MEKDLDEEEPEEKEMEEKETFECPTCGAKLTDKDSVCLECGEEFDDE